MKTMSLRWIVCAVSLGGLLFGFDAGVISGCEEAIQNEFKLAPFWHGLVVAGALIGTVFGALVAGRMCDRFGRKPTLVWMGVLFLISAAGCAVTPSGGRGATALPVSSAASPLEECRWPCRCTLPRSRLRRVVDALCSSTSSALC